MNAPEGILICGHGSRHRRACDQFESLAEKIRQQMPDTAVEYGYLEFARPTIRDAIARLHDKGCRVIRAVPSMLFAAGHMKNDIPSLLREEAEKYTDIDIRFGRELGFDLKLIKAAFERIEKIMPDKDPAQCALLVIGRGASDPDANSNVCKVMRLLWEGIGFGWGETAYSGVTFPLTAPALDKIAQLGYRDVVVFPYFLFTGVLIERIENAVAAARTRHPNISFHMASYLGSHPMVAATMIERIDEIDQGLNVMNCRMCKYRAPMIGFESEVALPQHGHHHHVEGILAHPDGHSNDEHPNTGHPNDGHHPDKHSNHGHSDDEHHPDKHPNHGHSNDGHDRKGHDRRLASPPPGEIHHHRENGTENGDKDGVEKSKDKHGERADHTHDHHPYPHADHPLGPVSMKKNP